MKRSRIHKLIAGAVVLGIVAAAVIVLGYPEIMPELHTLAAVEESAMESDGAEDASAADTGETASTSTDEETDIAASAETAGTEAESEDADTDAAPLDAGEGSSIPKEARGGVTAVEEKDPDEEWAEQVLADLPFSWDSSRIVTYFTAPYPSNKSSERNAKLASLYLNGTVVGAKKNFSYNEIVGERTKGRGFREAPVIYGDQLADGLGGGVCEVSTMLYNICLQSGMKVKERSPHTLQVPYVPGGLDAAVSWGSRDFKFQNPYDEPVTILTDYNNDAKRFIMVLTAKSGKNLLKDTRYVAVSEKTSDDPEDLTYESYLQVWHGSSLTNQIDLGTTTYYGLDDAE